MWSTAGRCLCSGGVDSFSVLPVAGQVPQHGDTTAEATAALNTSGQCRDACSTLL